MDLYRPGVPGTLAPAASDRFRPPLLRYLFERSPVSIEACRLARQLLPALDHDVDILRIKLHSVSDAFREFRGREGSAGTEEWVIDQLAASQVIQNWLAH